MMLTCSIMLREESSQPTFILARCSRLRGFNKLKNTRMRVIEGDNEEYECKKRMLMKITMCRQISEDVVGTHSHYSLLINH